MGLSSYPNSQDGLLPMIVVSFVLVAALLKSTPRSLLGPASVGRDLREQLPGWVEEGVGGAVRVSVPWRRRRRRRAEGRRQCCVCLCGFEEEEEVSERRYRHYFHRGCLQQWFDNLSISKLTCPLCRSLL